ncbi:MAG TPA: hypothetical protein VFB54_06030 [Burkholderiales bacterium]|nr:hypothetical protein [Burkholderiales bacterium]
MSAYPPSPARDKAILAAVAGATANIDWLTNDRIEALTGGHGMLNLSVIAIADVLAGEILRGTDVEVKFANARHQPVDDLLAKAIDAAREAGADGANAALLSAVMLYLAGAEAQVGIPAGNRKLGATARMIAGVDRCGVAAIPTGKMNNKISGFPAVLAINQAMLAGSLSPIDGRKVPPGIAAGPLYGHSTLGEDIVFPAMAERGARIGTQAMLDAFAGAGILPHAFSAALFGAAAILEIIHPDADVAEQYGPYGKVTSAFVAGSSAASTAGLPPELHFRRTGIAIPTGKLIGDLGLILKDIGGPTVIGMIALNEIMQVFAEFHRMTDPPLGHLCADAVVVFHALLQESATSEAVAAKLGEARATESIDPDTTMLSMNTVARKAAAVRRGPVTDTLILASEPYKIDALYRRAAFAYDGLIGGSMLADVVRLLDEQRQHTIEQRTSAQLSRTTGKKIDMRVTRIAAAARRDSKMARKWFVFDPLIDVEISVDGVTHRLEGFVHALAPKLARGEAPELAALAPLVAPMVGEMLVAANSIVNVTIPAAMAAALGLHPPLEAAEIAESAAKLSAGIPGGKARAHSAAMIAQRAMDVAA